MRITKELVNAVLAKTGTENLGKTLEHLQSVYHGITGVKQRMADAEKKHRKVIDELERQEAALQKTCPHPLMEHHVGACGGNGSHFECAVCGLVEDHDRGGYDG